VEVEEKAGYGAFRLPSQSIPIGSFLTAKVSTELTYHPEPSRFTNELAEKGSAAQVVLDGQQRITAGIQLFYGTSAEQGTHYFLDIEKLEKRFQTFATDKANL